MSRPRPETRCTEFADIAAFYRYSYGSVRSPEHDYGVQWRDPRGRVVGIRWRVSWVVATNEVIAVHPSGPVRLLGHMAEDETGRLDGWAEACGREPYTWVSDRLPTAYCLRCCEIAPVLGGICGTCADTLRDEAQAREADSA